MWHFVNRPPVVHILLLSNSGRWAPCWPYSLWRSCQFWFWRWLLPLLLLHWLGQRHHYLGHYHRLPSNRDAPNHAPAAFQVGEKRLGITELSISALFRQAPFPTRCCSIGKFEEPRARIAVIKRAEDKRVEHPMWFCKCDFWWHFIRTPHRWDMKKLQTTEKILAKLIYTSKLKACCTLVQQAFNLSWKMFYKLLCHLSELIWVLQILHDCVYLRVRLCNSCRHQKASDSASTKTTPDIKWQSSVHGVPMLNNYLKDLVTV